MLRLGFDEEIIVKFKAFLSFLEHVCKQKRECLQRIDRKDKQDLEFAS